MKPLISTLIITFLLSLFAFGQKRVAGKIHDYDDGTLLPKVAIQNLNHKNLTTTSDTDGSYSIAVYKNDSVRFILKGYQPRTLIFTGENEAWFESVLFTSDRVILDTVTIRQALTNQQKNSIDHEKMYSKTLNYKPPKTKLPKLKDLEAGKPLKVYAPLSRLLGKTTKEYKKNKKFKEMYTESESQAFINSRYDTALVTQLTNLKDDALHHFMQAYPISLQYANAATDIEMEMWIKYNYREWMKSNEKPTDTIAPRSGYLKKP